MGYKVTLYDNSETKLKDLGSNIFLRETDVGKSRSIPTVNTLKKLNEFSQINMCEKIDFESFELFIKDSYSCVIVTDLCFKNKTKTLFNINLTCRKLGIPFILALNIGAHAYIFNDFGLKFHVYNKTGDKPKTWPILNIKYSNPCRIYYHKTTDNLFEDMEIFIKGIDEIPENKICKIFSIGCENQNNYLDIDIDSTNFKKTYKYAYIS
jgi:molybdopterin/thiamine biosynthesis adenylyltransferase